MGNCLACSITDTQCPSGESLSLQAASSSPTSPPSAQNFDDGVNFESVSTDTSPRNVEIQPSLERPSNRLRTRFPQSAIRSEPAVVQNLGPPQSLCDPCQPLAEPVAPVQGTELTCDTQVARLDSASHEHASGLLDSHPNGKECDLVDSGGVAESSRMGLTLECSESSIVVRGPEGRISFSRDRFQVLEDTEAFKIIRGPYDDEVLEQEEARKLKVEYYAQGSVYIVEMVNKFPSGFAPDMKEGILHCFRRKKIEFVDVCGNGAEGFVYGGGAGGGKDLFVPDHVMFRAPDADRAVAQTKKGFHEVSGQFIQEVESGTDPRNPNTSSEKLTTYQKCVRLLESGQVEFAIAWYPRTKEVQIHFRNAAGQIDQSPVYFNPEFIPLDTWPGGIFAGLRLYLSNLRLRKSLWGAFKAGEKFNPDGSDPRWAGRDKAPIDPPDVARRQHFFEQRIYPLSLSERSNVLVEVSKEGELEDLRMTVSHCDNVNRRSQDGRLALVEAVVSGSVEKVDELLTQGAEADEKDVYGRTAAAMAVVMGAAGNLIVDRFRVLGVPIPTVTVDEVSKWLRRVADADPAPIGLLEELSSLVEGSKPGAVLRAVRGLVSDDSGVQLDKLLCTTAGTAILSELARDAEPVLSTVEAAARWGHDEALCVLKNHGILDMKGEGGETALMRLAEGSDVRSIKALLRAGAGVDVQDGDGLTALDHAQKFGRGKMVEELKKRGAEE
eukprot:TRINITY_DN17765_c0_g1_i1.p1 TRINITY_DN17765_c0_g1~~TRINITY_DN17765_c0_g1_i1.p1  ORF type:complete len:723 (+),score=108.76 TRINITY_DN17765_c0_g1_i1:137-2305(+)